MTDNSIERFGRLVAQYNLDVKRARKAFCDKESRRLVSDGFYMERGCITAQTGERIKSVINPSLSIRDCVMFMIGYIYGESSK